MKPIAKRQMTHSIRMLGSFLGCSDSNDPVLKYGSHLTSHIAILVLIGDLLVIVVYLAVKIKTNVEIRNYLKG